MASPVDVTIYPKQIAWNSITWTTSLGGPLALRYSLMGREIAERTGDDVQPRGVYVVDQGARVWVRLRAVKQTLVRGIKSNLVATVALPDGSTELWTFVGMVFAGANGNQDRGLQGDIELEFAYESADGAAEPLS
jgi:hypothetical protein